MGPRETLEDRTWLLRAKASQLLRPHQTPWSTACSCVGFWDPAGALQEGASPSKTASPRRTPSALRQWSCTRADNSCLAPMDLPRSNGARVGEVPDRAERDGRHPVVHGTTNIPCRYAPMLRRALPATHSRADSRRPP